MCMNNGLEAQGGNMEFEESEESSQMMEEEMNENHSQSDFRELVVQMRRANLCFQQMCSVPMGELTMLLSIHSLSENHAPVMISRLGNYLKLSKPAVSRMLHVLKNKGYIQMENGKEDQRYVFVETTEKGRELMQKEMFHCHNLIQRVKERMGEEDMHDFLYYNKKFYSILEEEYASR